MKQWIVDREGIAAEILGSSNIRLNDLTNHSLLIHISYGGQASGGRSVIARIERIEIRYNSLYFDFDQRRIKVSFDVTPGQKLGGAFSRFGINEEIEIEGLSLSNAGYWHGIFWARRIQYEMHSENIDVKFL